MNVILSRGEVVNVKFITDEDIRSGKAAHILKGVAGLYVTTADDMLLENFVYRPELVESVGSWRQMREELGAGKDVHDGAHDIVRFDTRTMKTEVVSVSDTTAKILIDGGRDIYRSTQQETWKNFEFGISYEKVHIENQDYDEQVYVNFTKSNGRWMFTGYTSVE